MSHKKILSLAVVLILLLSPPIFGVNNNSDLQNSKISVLPTPSLASSSTSVKTSPSELNDLPNITSPEAIKMSVGGWTTLTYNWRDIASMDEYIVPVSENRTDYFQLAWLVNRGVKISVGIYPDWNETTSALDTYYSSSYREAQLKRLDDSLNVNWIHLVSGVVIGDEEPAAGSLSWLSLNSPLPQFLAKYNSTYFEELGFYLKGADKMNGTESFIFRSWFNNRTTSAMNLIYDHVKAINPTWQVMWGLMPWEGLDIANLKTDRFNAGGSTYVSNPRSIYSTIRTFKTLHPQTDFLVYLYGASILDNVFLTPDDLIKQFWTAYSAGTDYINYFNFGYSGYGDALDLSLRSSEYWRDIVEINNIGNKYPVINPQPSVLEVACSWSVTCAGYDPYPLSSYDIGSQNDLSRNYLNLSKYSTVVLDNSPIWDDSVPLLNEYIETGGNMAVLRGSVIDQNQEYSPLAAPISIFDSSLHRKDFAANYLNVSITTPESFQLRSSKIISRSAYNITGQPDIVPIPMNTEEEKGGYYSVFLYHDSSKPNSGTVLFVGLDKEEDPEFYKTLMRYSYHTYLGVVEEVQSADTPVGIGLDSQDNLIISSAPAEGRDFFMTEINISRWIPTVTDVTATRDSLLNSFHSLYLNSYEVPGNGLINVGDTVFPNEFIHYTVYPSSVDPRPRVFVKSMTNTFAIGDEIPITASITVEHGFDTLTDIQSLIDIPDNLRIINTLYSYFPDSPISPGTSVSVTWLVEASKAGQYTVPIVVNATSKTSSKVSSSALVSARFGVRSEKVEVSLSKTREGVVITGDTFDLYPTIFVSSSKPTVTLTLDTLMLDYKFGNPGGIEKLYDFPTNVAKKIKVHVGVAAVPKGTLGNYIVKVFAGENGIWDDSYVLVDSYPSKLTMTSPLDTTVRAGANDSIDVTVQARGVEAAEGVTVQLQSASLISVPNSFEIDSISLHQPYTFTFNINSENSGRYPVKVIISGNNIPTTEYTLQVTVRPKILLNPYVYIPLSMITGGILIILSQNYERIRSFLKRPPKKEDISSK